MEVRPDMAYWSLLSGPALLPVEPVDHYLRHLRFARGRAESTTRTYAHHLRMFELWRVARSYSWEDAASEIADFLIYRRLSPRQTPGRNQGQRPSEAALGPTVAALHGFYRHAVDLGFVDERVLAVLFERAEVVMQDGSRSAVLRPKLRVATWRRREPQTLGPVGATLDEFATMVRAASTARDACLIAFMGALGLRVGQVASLLRSDIHFIPTGQRIGECVYDHGAHLHVVRRPSHPRGAISKSPLSNIVPVSPALEGLYARWLHERRGVRRAADAPWAFVSFDGPCDTKGGEPLSTRRIYGIVTSVARGSGLRHIHPHMLRHTFGSTASDLNIARDIVQRLLGHESIASQDVYRQPPEARVIEAAREIGARLNQ